MVTVNKVMDTKVKKDIAHYINQLETEGYCRIPNVFTERQMRQALDLTKIKFEETRCSQSDRMPFLNKGQHMVYNLQSKHPFFLELLFSSRLMEDILKHFLNDPWFKSVPENDPNYILRSYLARSSNHQMPLHIDSLVPYQGSFVFVMQCAMVLEDQNEENGCTVVVPGSHFRPEYATQKAFDEAIPIISRAGDLVMWDSRVWHGTKANGSGNTRWSIIATFQRWWLKQAFNIPGTLPQEIYDCLTDAQKSVLGFCSVPYENETFGIDMKRSYALLPKKVDDYRL